MRKRFINPTAESIRTRGPGWLDVERATVVEVTSEDKDFPVESIFVSGDERGWRAAAPGAQTIRLIFDQSQTLRCVSLVFEENETGIGGGLARASLSARRSSFCGGLQIVRVHSKKLSASNGLSAHLN